MSEAAVRTRPWWLRLAGYVREHWRGFGFLLVLLVVEAALVALKPWPVKLIVDHVLIGRALPERATRLVGALGLEAAPPVTLLALFASLTVALFVVVQAFTLVQRQVSVAVGQGLVQRLRADVFDRLQRLSPRFYARHSAGDLVRRVITDTGCIRTLVMGVLVTHAGALVRLAIMFTVMWHLNRTLAVVVALAGLPLGMISRFFNRRMTERALEEQRLDGQMTALAEQTLTVLPVVKSFGREDDGDLRFAKLSRRSLQATKRSTMSQMQFHVATGTVRSACIAAVMVLGGFYVLDGTLTLGALLVCLAYLNTLLGPLEGLAYATISFASAAAGAQRVFEVMDSEEQVREVAGARPLPAIVCGQGARVRLERVVFGYEEGRPILHEIDLEVPPGQTLALVGPTGAGKSTLISLLPRFFDPWQGRVLVQGTDVREVQLQSLRAQIALVLQEALVLPVSIAENIAYGRPEASRAEIEAVARAANAHQFIEQLPQGYDTVIGERGATLSGGERQRLSIARAFLKDAPILILDEPTSALDAGTEVLVMEALERLMRGRTVLVIAHRLSTVRRADQIAVLQQGRIVELGSPDELLSANGSYAELHRIQFGGFAPVLPAAV
jgi:ATP-binding cassette, subfamily B, bacterial